LQGRRRQRRQQGRLWLQRARRVGVDALGWRGAGARRAGGGGSASPSVSPRAAGPMIIDAWIQHPTPRLMAHPMLDSLKRWMGLDPGAELPPVPIEMTIGALDAANVDRALCSAWYGPAGSLVSNDEVAAFVA